MTLATHAMSIAGPEPTGRDGDIHDDSKPRARSRRAGFSSFLAEPGRLIQATMAEGLGLHISAIGA